MRESSRQGFGCHSVIRGVLAVFLTVGCALLISFLARSYLVRSFFIPSPSMASTLEIDDRILVNRLVPSLVPIERGDIVVFRDTAGWVEHSGGELSSPQPDQPGLVAGALQGVGLLPEEGLDFLVKRVVGKGGDRVVCCDAQRRVLVNGVPLTEDYLLRSGVPRSTPDIAYDVTVPEGSLWVLGDNRGNSADSRSHQSLPSGGFVAERDVVGRAFMRTWPLERFGWL